MNENRLTFQARVNQEDLDMLKDIADYYYVDRMTHAFKIMIRKTHDQIQKEKTQVFDEEDKGG